MADRAAGRAARGYERLPNKPPIVDSAGGDAEGAVPVPRTFLEGWRGMRSPLDKLPPIVYTRRVKLIVRLKLLTSPDDHRALLATLERANDAANLVSEHAWQTSTFGRYALQKACYFDVKAGFGLTAQVVVRLFAKVADAYKRDRKRPRVFRRHGSIAYDDRILKYLPERVSLWTPTGRRKIGFVCDDRTRQLLKNRQGESDLVYRDGSWFLYATVNYGEPLTDDVEDVIGIDLGVVNLAVDSDGKRYSGAHVNSLRQRHRRLRAKLSRKFTPSARRRLNRRRRNERRFAAWVNHNLSKRIVAEAQRTKRAIALEDLTGIRTRIRARKPQRATLHSWSFHQLCSFIVYKAKMVGVRVVLVDPRNTSRTCPDCGHCAKENRPDQATFYCQSCGLAGLADLIAALNIRVRGWAALSQPDADAVGSASRSAGRRMPPASAGR
jgi:putative transposase